MPIRCVVPGGSAQEMVRREGGTGKVVRDQTDHVAIERHRARDTLHDEDELRDAAGRDTHERACLGSRAIFDTFVAHRPYSFCFR